LNPWAKCLTAASFVGWDAVAIGELGEGSARADMHDSLLIARSHLLTAFRCRKASFSRCFYAIM
jgi:hypothetical protein